MKRPIASPTGRTVAAVIMLLGLPLLPRIAIGCPFCSVVRNTLSEEMATADAVIVARLARSLAPRATTGDSSTGNQSINSSVATFTIDTILTGKDVLGTTKSFSTAFFGDAKTSDLFLVMASNLQNLSWSPPLRLNDRQHEYLMKLVTLPKEGPERLAFFQQYLQDSDDMLARDAYDEFARTPYAGIKQLRSKMDHDQLVQWIQNPEISASHRRLYLTMLGVCGGQDDLPMLEQRMRGTDPPSKSGLDALIACFLTLRGPAGVELVEDLYLKKRDDNFSGDYADVYAAIMALRFHGSEEHVIPRERVVKAFSHLLDNPQMADLIVPDLARWEDWSQLERLVEVFKNVDAKSTWIRVPIVNYTRVCPRSEAKKALKEFEKIDPDAVKRAMTFYPTLQNKAD